MSNVIQFPDLKKRQRDLIIKNAIFKRNRSLKWGNSESQFNDLLENVHPVPNDTPCTVCGTLRDKMYSYSIFADVEIYLCTRDCAIEFNKTRFKP